MNLKQDEKAQMRVIQPAGRRGSLKWIQMAVNERWPALDGPILQATGAATVEWLSPPAGFADHWRGKVTWWPDRGLSAHNPVPPLQSRLDSVENLLSAALAAEEPSFRGALIARAAALNARAR